MLNNMEIERKFLIDMNKVPYDFNVLNKKAISQGYIFSVPHNYFQNISLQNFNTQVFLAT